MIYKKIEALKEGDILKNTSTKDFVTYLGDYYDDERHQYATFRNKEFNSGFHLIRKKELLKFFDVLDNVLIIYGGADELY